MNWYQLVDIIYRAINDCLVSLINFKKRIRAKVSIAI